MLKKSLSFYSFSIATFISAVQFLRVFTSQSGSAAQAGSLARSQKTEFT